VLKFETDGFAQQYWLGNPLKIRQWQKILGLQLWRGSFLSLDEMPQSGYLFDRAEGRLLNLFLLDIG
jgi:hypothetical protein